MQNASLGIDAIFICEILREQGAHKIMKLATEKIKRAHVTLNPIAPIIINIVESLNKADKLTDLKLELHEGFFYMTQHQSQ
jgi:hypothetical protein